MLTGSARRKIKGNSLPKISSNKATKLQLYPRGSSKQVLT